MKCLILAAGLGTRLRGIAESKPLAPLGGKPLIEHVITRAAAGGAREFFVVTGYRADALEAFLGELSARHNLTITCVRCEDWERPNGHSVLAGAAVLTEPFLLLMSDHLFDPEIARRLIEGGGREADVVLAVDRALNGPLLDVDDATKVQVGADGRIEAIGKTIDPYNAIDTGLFLATPALAQAIRDAVDAGGGGSLSEGVQRLADAGRAQTMDVGEASWIDVDSPAMMALAETLVSRSFEGQREA